MTTITFVYQNGTTLETKDPGAREYAERVGLQEGYGPIVDERSGTNERGPQSAQTCAFTGNPATHSYIPKGTGERCFVDLDWVQEQPHLREQIGGYKFEPLNPRADGEGSGEAVIADLLIGRCPHGALVGFCTYGPPCEQLCRRLQAAVEKFGAEDVEPCTDCREPVRYDKRAESWRHVEKAAERCFMVNGNGATLDADENVAPKWEALREHGTVESLAAHPSLQEKSTDELKAKLEEKRAQLEQDEEYLPDEHPEKRELLDRMRESIAALELALEWRGEVIS